MRKSLKIGLSLVLCSLTLFVAMFLTGVMSLNGIDRSSHQLMVIPYFDFDRYIIELEKEFPEGREHLNLGKIQYIGNLDEVAYYQAIDRFGWVGTVELENHEQYRFSESHVNLFTPIGTEKMRPVAFETPFISLVQGRFFEESELEMMPTNESVTPVIISEEVFYANGFSIGTQFTLYHAIFHPNDSGQGNTLDDECFLYEESCKLLPSKFEIIGVFYIPPVPFGDDGHLIRQQALNNIFVPNHFIWHPNILAEFESHGFSEVEDFYKNVTFTLENLADLEAFEENLPALLPDFYTFSIVPNGAPEILYGMGVVRNGLIFLGVILVIHLLVIGGVICYATRNDQSFKQFRIKWLVNYVVLGILFSFIGHMLSNWMMRFRLGSLFQNLNEVRAAENLDDFLHLVRVSFGVPITEPFSYEEVIPLFLVPLNGITLLIYLAGILSILLLIMAIFRFSFLNCQYKSD